MPKATRNALLNGQPHVIDGSVQFEADGASVRVCTVPDRDGLRLRAFETPMTSFVPADLLTRAEIDAVQQKVTLAYLADGETDQWMTLLFGCQLVGGAGA